MLLMLLREAIRDVGVLTGNSFQEQVGPTSIESLSTRAQMDHGQVPFNHGERLRDQDVRDWAVLGVPVYRLRRLLRCRFISQVFRAALSVEVSIVDDEDQTGEESEDIFWLTAVVNVHCSILWRYDKSVDEFTQAERFPGVCNPAQECERILLFVFVEILK